MDTCIHVCRGARALCAGAFTQAIDVLSVLHSLHTQARLRERSATNAEVRAANLRGAMRLARQVVVGFSGTMAAPGVQQVQLLEVRAGWPVVFRLCGRRCLLSMRSALQRLNRRARFQF